MSTNFSSTVPAAPAGRENGMWQTDGSGNMSVSIPSPTLDSTNTSIISLVPGDVLVWNGSQWVNAGLPSIIGLNLPVYANNAAAISGGLVAGNLYRTGANPDPVCVVH